MSSDRTRQVAPEPDGPAPAARPRWSDPRRLLVGGGLLLVLGVGGAGVVGGFWLAERYAAPPAPVLQLARDVPGAGAAAPGAVLPDVVLLSRADAEDTLADAGFDLARVEVVEAPWAGPAGRVVAQEPRRGARGPRSVTLTISTPATVPAVVGKPQEEARGALEALGAVIATTPVYVPGAQLGTVVAVDPPVAKALTERVVLRVAGEPAAVFLDAVVPESGGCRSEQADLGGERFPHALTCVSSSSPSEVSYLVDGIDRFESAIGVPAGGSGATVRVLLDGKVLVIKSLKPGAVEQLALDVRGGRRLVLEGVAAAGADRSEWVLGDPRLLGSVEAVDRQAAGRP